MTDNDKTAQLIKRLLETTQDVFIFQSVQAGVSRDVIKSILRVDTDRVTRVSRLVPRKSRKKEF